MKVWSVVTAAFLMSAGATVHAQEKAKAKPPQKGAADMTFFVTSVGKGNGADLGGLEGADAHCNELAKAAGSKRTNWKAYLSTTAANGSQGVNARDRIGKGPWRVNKKTALTEKGEPVKGRGDQPNEHDILTGSDPGGMYSTAGGDTTCRNWTSSGEGSAILGHHDRIGLNDSWHMKSWNSSHGSRGCSQDNLKSTGGAGLFYCFVPN
jgi:hypothetical protein